MKNIEKASLMLRNGVYLPLRMFSRNLSHSFVFYLMGCSCLAYRKFMEKKDEAAACKRSDRKVAPSNYPKLNRLFCSADKVVLRIKTQRYKVR